MPALVNASLVLVEAVIRPYLEPDLAWYSRGYETASLDQTRWANEKHMLAAAVSRWDLRPRGDCWSRCPD